MIQRIQTLFLFVAAGIAIAINFLNIGTINFDIVHPECAYNAFTVKDVATGDTLARTTWIAVLWIFSAIISLVTIFMYKNRQVQVRLNGVNMLVMLCALVTMLYIYPNFVFEKEVIFNKWMCLSLIPAICLYLANMFIKRDEKKVRAADRLR